MSALSKSRAARSASEETIRVNRGRVDSIDLFEVKENELDALEHGASGDLLLNVAIALLSVALSILVTIFTAAFTSEFVRQIVTIIMVVGFVTGPILIIFWFRDRNTARAVINRIRSRVSIPILVPLPPARLRSLQSDPITVHLPTSDDPESPQG